jgi:hypothetical protein
VKAARSPRAVQPAQQEAVVLRAAPLLRLERALLALEERAQARLVPLPAAQARRVAPKTELVRTALEQRAPEKRRSVLAPVSRS